MSEVTWLPFSALRLPVGNGERPADTPGLGRETKRLTLLPSTGRKRDADGLSAREKGNTPRWGPRDEKGGPDDERGRGPRLQRHLVHGALPQQRHPVGGLRGRRRPPGRHRARPLLSPRPAGQRKRRDPGKGALRRG